MFDVIAQGMPELTGAIGGGGQPLMDGAEIMMNSVQNQQTSGVATLFNLLETGIRLLIGFAVLGAVGFIAKGAIDLMRAGGSPQMMEKARNQIVLALGGAAVAVASFFMVGTVIDFLAGASGNAIVDPGSPGIQAAKQTVQLNGFLGIYGGQGIVCEDPTPNEATDADADLDATKDVKPDGTLAVTADWKYYKATTSAPAYCKEN